MGMVVGLETRHKTRYSPFKSFHEIETGISEQSKRVPIFLHDVREGKPSEFLSCWTETQTNTGELGPSLGGLASLACLWSL